MKISIRWDLTDWKIARHWLFSCFACKHPALEHIYIRISTTFGFCWLEKPPYPFWLKDLLHEILVVKWNSFSYFTICMGINICISRAEIKLTSIFNSVESVKCTNEIAWHAIFYSLPLGANIKKPDEIFSEIFCCFDLSDENYLGIFYHGTNVNTANEENGLNCGNVR